MNKRFTTAILLLIMILLIACIGILGVAVYLDLTRVPIATTDTIYETQEIKVYNTSSSSKETNEKNENIEKNVTTEVITDTESIFDKIQGVFSKKETEDNSVQYVTNSADNFFYAQLNNTEKNIYDGLENNKENLKTGKYAIQYGDNFTDVLSQENGGDILGVYYQNAIEAFLQDNPEVFYINANKMYMNMQTITKGKKVTYNCYIDMGNQSNYYADGFYSYEQVQTAVNEVENKKDKIINSLSGSTYEKISKVHDYLVDNISYDTTYSNIGTYSIYGALAKNICVCEGYAKAFKYILDDIGIPCELIKGVGTTSTGEQENHAWNDVYIDGNWYAIDVTWDDPIIRGGSLTQKLKYKYFLVGSTELYKDHTEDNKYISGSGTFSNPVLSLKNYR